MSESHSLEEKRRLCQQLTLPAPCSPRMPPADSSDDDDDGYYGPSLPPASPPPVQRQDVIGPVLPPQWTGLREDQGEDEGDDLTIGPLPPGDTAHDPHRDHQPLVRKSQQDLPKREEWMTVVPAKVEKRLGFKSVTSFSQRPVGPAVPKKAAAAGNAEEQSDDHAAVRNLVYIIIICR